MRAEVEYDYQTYDIINEINRVLYLAGTHIQFVYDDNHKYDGTTEYYDLEERDDWVKI